MKNKKVIVGLILCIILVVILDAGLVLYNLKQNKDTRVKYICSGEDKIQEIKEINLSYQTKSNYEFYVTKENRIENGAIKTNFIFKTKEDYDAFIEKVDKVNTEERMKEYDEQNLTITFIFSNTFPNFAEDDQTSFTENYFAQLENLNFHCIQ